MTSTYLGSNSITRALLPSCSEAITVVPLPPKMSRTTSPCLEELRMCDANMRTGFIVGWSEFREGFGSRMTVVAA